MRSFGWIMLSAAAALGGCRYDPVIADRIRRMPVEDDAGPSPEHRPGQACVDCHSKYERAKPELAVGGTIFSETGKGFLKPVPGVFVTINDSGGATYKACTNKAGNFYITKDDLQGIDDFAFPMTVKVAGTTMQSLIGRERSCANCHKLASNDRLDRDPNVDPATGRSRDSAGAILIDPTVVNLLEKCGVGLTKTTTSGAGGAGGATGAGGAGTGGAGTGGAASSSTAAAGGAGGATGTAGGGGA